MGSPEINTTRGDMMGEVIQMPIREVAQKWNWRISLGLTLIALGAAIMGITFEVNRD